MSDAATKHDLDNLRSSLRALVTELNAAGVERVDAVKETVAAEIQGLDSELQRLDKILWGIESELWLLNHPNATHEERVEWEEWRKVRDTTD